MTGDQQPLTKGYDRFTVEVESLRKTLSTETSVVNPSSLILRPLSQFHDVSSKVGVLLVRWFRRHLMCHTVSRPQVGHDRLFRMVRVLVQGGSLHQVRGNSNSLSVWVTRSVSGACGVRERLRQVPSLSGCPTRRLVGTGLGIWFLSTRSGTTG